MTPVAFFSKYPWLSKTPSRVDAPFAIQVIILAVVYDTHTGAAPQFAPRLTPGTMGARWTSFGRVSSRSVRGFVSYVCTEIMQCSADILLSPGCKHEHEPSTAVINTNLTSPTPHMLVPLIYSLSTTAKRDIVGRKPRQKIFSRDGSCSVHDAGSWRSGGGDQVYIPLHIQ